MLQLPAQQSVSTSRPDSAHRYHITAKGLAETGAAVLLTSVADLTVRHFAQQNRNSTTNAVAQVGDALGSPGYVAGPLVMTYLMGHVTHRPKLALAAFHAGESALLGSTTTLVVKLFVGRARPYQNLGMASFHPFGKFDASFPSGHTTFAFAVATSLAGKTGSHWLDALWYGAATTTAFARINDDQHWFSDVLAGAVVGHVAAKLVSNYHNRFLVSAGPGVIGVRVAF